MISTRCSLSTRLVWFAINPMRLPANRLKDAATAEAAPVITGPLAPRGSCGLFWARTKLEPPHVAVADRPASTERRQMRECWPSLLIVLMPGRRMVCSREVMTTRTNMMDAAAKRPPQAEPAQQVREREPNCGV